MSWAALVVAGPVMFHLKDKKMGDVLQNPFGVGSQAVPTTGTKSGGSKPTPQAQRMTTGSGSRSAKVSIPTSRPKNSQKLRG